VSQSVSPLLAVKEPLHLNLLPSENDSLPTMNSRIIDLWKAHCSDTFPGSCGGREIEGIDLALLETEAAGCIQSFIAGKGRLDFQRTAILGLCYRDLSIVVGQLDHEAKTYFVCLEEIAHLVLGEIATDEKD
jgi:hypothetical protein